MPARGDVSVSAATRVDGIAAAAALLRDSRGRLRGELADNDRRSGLLTGGSFLVAVAAWILLAPPASVPIAVLAGCVAAYVVAGCVEFEIGPGCALPTMPVQVVMLFLLPPQLVPVAVGLGLVGAARLGRVRDPQRRERPMVLAGSGWQAVGPAAVFALAHVHGPELSYWPVYVLALLAQFTSDSASSWVRNCYGLRVPTGQLASALRFTFVCDLFLAPIGFAATRAVPHSPGALVFLLPPTALLAMLQSDRRKQIDQTVALGAAFTDTSDLARRDALTGVANRLSWEEVTARLQRRDQPIGVILADVDGLKAANDTLGHATGDRLLVAVAEMLQRAVPEESGGLLFRIGGDEFAILLPDATATSTDDLGSAIRAAFENEPTLDGVIAISASVGVGFATGGAVFGPAVATADRGVHLEKDRRGVRRR